MREEYEQFKQNTKKNYLPKLKDLRRIFLTYQYNNRPYFITLITLVDLEYLTLFIKILEVEYSQFYNLTQSSLVFTLHLPTQYKKISNRRHIIILTNKELYTLKGIRGLLNIERLIKVIQKKQDILNKETNIKDFTIINNPTL